MLFGIEDHLGEGNLIDSLILVGVVLFFIAEGFIRRD
jgi:hypothetical protein